MLISRLGTINLICSIIIPGYDYQCISLHSHLLRPALMQMKVDLQVHTVTSRNLSDLYVNFDKHSSSPDIKL